MHDVNSDNQKRHLFLVFFCFLTFSSLCAQLNVAKESSAKIVQGKLLSSKNSGDYIEETRLLLNKTDTIVLLYDKHNSTKLIKVRNTKEGISTAQFHKYASEMNPQFKVYS